MTKGKVVFAGTFRVESISVPVQLIRSGRKTIGVKVDKKGVVSMLIGSNSMCSEAELQPSRRRMPDGFLRRCWSIWHSRQCR